MPDPKPKRVVAETVVFTKVHQAWKAMLTKGESRRMFFYQKAGRAVFILAPSERRALLKWSEIEKGSVPVQRVSRETMAGLIAAEMDRLEETSQFHSGILRDQQIHNMANTFKEKLGDSPGFMSLIEKPNADQGGADAGAVAEDREHPEPASSVPEGSGSDHAAHDAGPGWDPNS